MSFQCEDCGKHGILNEVCDTCRGVEHDPLDTPIDFNEFRLAAVDIKDATILDAMEEQQEYTIEDLCNQLFEDGYEQRQDRWQHVRHRLRKLESTDKVVLKSDWDGHIRFVKPGDR